jgi:MFS family permease
MDRGFFIILGAQFLSALADNALFIAAISLLKQQHAPEWHLSMLLWCFTLSYVILAPFAGSFADSMHKGRAMMICNGIKLLGCLGMLVGAPPLLAYALVGFGAAAYSPAKYGIITEYLPHEKLVAANGWLEGATVTAIVFGTVLGGLLISPLITPFAYALLPAHWSVQGPQIAIAVIGVVYLLASWLNIYIPKLQVVLKPLSFNPKYLLYEFSECVVKLWRDPKGQLSLGVTTLFWGAGATMRLIVINWAIIWLALSLEQSTQLVAVVALGTALGAGLAGKLIPLKKAFSVLPAGIMMGIVVMCMLAVTHVWMAALLMFIVGVLSGLFVVPLNAMLQHRGYMLMGAGHSIAVQNFNENLGILAMVGIHAMLVKYLSSPVPSGASVNIVKQFTSAGGIPPMHLIIIGFGMFVMLVMAVITWRYNKRVKVMPEDEEAID